MLTCPDCIYPLSFLDPKANVSEINIGGMHFYYHETCMPKDNIQLYIYLIKLYSQVYNGSQRDREAFTALRDHFQKHLLYSAHDKLEALTRS